MKRTTLSILILLFILPLGAQVYYDYSAYELKNANNEGDIRFRKSYKGSGDVQQIKDWCDQAQLPNNVRDSRLTQGDFSANIAQMGAVVQTLKFLANQPDTCNVEGIVVTKDNLEQHRVNIEADGGTFIFKDSTFIDADNVETAKEKLIKVGSNTTIWIDGVVEYRGPVIPGTVPDEFSVGDVIHGIFEVRNAQYTSIYGTKRCKLMANNRVAGVHVNTCKNLRVEGVRTYNCRNVLFIHKVTGASILKGNFIYNSARRAIHLKATNGIIVENNLIYNADVDGIDVDAFAQSSKVRRNVIIDGGSRYQVWTEIAVASTILDGNVGIHVNNSQGGFQENGSETHQPATSRNTWINNHIFYVNSTSKFNQGFSMHKSRKIERETIKFENNYVWQTVSNAYKNNPKPDYETDVLYYLFNPNAPFNDVPVVGIEVSDTVVEILQGQSQRIQASILPKNAKNIEIRWSSTNSKIAKVSGGKITGLAIGSAEIRAKSLSNDAIFKIIKVDVIKTPPLQFITHDLTNMEVIEVDSYDQDKAERGEKEYAIDDDKETFWHTRWENAKDPLPHHIVIDFGKELPLDEVDYLPRQDQYGPNGAIGEYEIYVSNSTVVWGASKASGKFSWGTNPSKEDYKELKTISIDSTVYGRYFKLVALTEAQSISTKPYTAIAELAFRADFEGVSILKDSLSLAVGTSGSLSAKVLPLNDQIIFPITWKSTNTTVASVNQNGEIGAMELGETNIIVSILDGDYTDTCRLIVNQETGISDIFMHVNIYPNPSIGEIYVTGTYTTKEHIYTLYSLNGKLLRVGTLNNKGKIDVFDLENGVYILKLNAPAAMLTKKIILHKE